MEGDAKDEAGLRHRTLDGVDEQEAAIGHIEDAFYFSAKVGVARRVDDVDFVALVGDSGVLGEDGNATLPLEVVGVEDEFAYFLMFAEDVGLFEHGIDERCFCHGQREQ